MRAEVADSCSAWRPTEDPIVIVRDSHSGQPLWPASNLSPQPG